MHEGVADAAGHVLFAPGQRLDLGLAALALVLVGLGEQALGRIAAARLDRAAASVPPLSHRPVGAYADLATS